MATKTADDRVALKVINGGAELDVEAELARFEAQERRRLGLDSAQEQWVDGNPNLFTSEDREHTTLLIAGLTHAHDTFVQAALTSAGFKVQTLDCPDNDALRFGKEFGNRGQCNPTYFTVGNLVKYLSQLRDQGLSTQEIVDNYVFMTAGACGPCRFGMYVTEYRKALRDAGFDGFRVLLVSQGGGVHAANGDGLTMSRKDIMWTFRGIMMGDVLNALMYRIRPYEVEPGASDRAIAECRTVIATALRERKSLLKAAWRCRKILSRVKVDRTIVKPKVGIIGEFWAMTTEGDGNYKLQRFLESEGAEVDIQIITNWLLYLISEKQWDTERRALLRNHDEGKRGLQGIDIRKKVLGLWAADKFMRLQFQIFAKIMGLSGYALSKPKELGEISHRYYDRHLRGGESYLEVGKVIHNVLHNKVNMTVSVKPFGCMPSSGVSDGVQSLVTEMYPQAIFLAIETSGDAAVNVYSRVQMQLFKAKQVAQKEVRAALDTYGLMTEDVREWLEQHPKRSNALHYSPHVDGCTAADVVHEVARRKGRTPRRPSEGSVATAPA
jgi:predicted nucleotide-binding protein (sugar kinase/HSP70/actin superfamily)